MFDHDVRGFSLFLNFSIVLSLYICHTTRMVGRNRTTTSTVHFTSNNKLQTIHTLTAHLNVSNTLIACISLNTPLYQDRLHLIQPSSKNRYRYPMNLFEYMNKTGLSIRPILLECQSITFLHCNLVASFAWNNFSKFKVPL